MLLNIENTLELTQSCLFVLDIANRIGTQVSNRKYYAALRVKITLIEIAFGNHVFLFTKTLCLVLDGGGA